MNFEGNQEPNFNDVDPIIFRKYNYRCEKRVVHKGPEPGVYPQRGALVTINLRGMVAPDKIVEDVMAYQCHLGDCDLVDGLEMALLAMKQGEIATVSMDFEFGYGIFGLKNNNGAYLVPPFAKLRYIVELLSIEEEILEEIDDNEILRRRFAFKKARGDFWLKRLEFRKTINLYNRALDYLLKMDGDVVAIGQAAGLPLTNDGIVGLVLRRKRAVFAAAVTESQVITSLQRDPRNTETLFHVAKLLKLMGKSDQAYELLQRVTQLDREHRDAAAEADAFYYYQLQRGIWRLFQIHPHVERPVIEDNFYLRAMDFFLFGLIIIVMVRLIFDA